MRQRWVAGARPRTLPASAVPVVVGSAVAGAAGHFVWWRALLAVVVALALQVATNYANDYSDGVRGTDEVRVGPVRLVASGLASPAAVKRAAIIAFAVAGVAGLALAAVAAWWLILVGAACIAAGWLYTGGPRPYGYAGLGEVFVFVFFGLVATVGTAYVQLGRITGLAVAGRRARRAARGGPAGGQQPAGHPRRHRRRQADPGRPHRRPRHPHRSTSPASVGALPPRRSRGGRRPHRGPARRSSPCPWPSARPAGSWAAASGEGADRGARRHRAAGLAGLRASCWPWPDRPVTSRGSAIASRPRRQRASGALQGHAVAGARHRHESWRWPRCRRPAGGRGPGRRRRARRPSPAPASTARPRRSHSGSWVPVPARRRLEARPAAVSPSRLSSAAAPGRQGGEQWPAQPPAARRPRPRRARRARPGPRRRAAARPVRPRSSMPAVALTRTSRSPGRAGPAPGAGRSARPSSSRRRSAGPPAADDQRRPPTPGRPRPPPTRRGPAASTVTTQSVGQPLGHRGSQLRPDWVKPWRSTTGRPSPRPSCEHRGILPMTRGCRRRPGRLRRHPRRRMGARRGHRRRRGPRVTVHTAARGAGRRRPPPGPPRSSTSAPPASSPSASGWPPAARRRSSPPAAPPRSSCTRPSSRPTRPACRCSRSPPTGPPSCTTSAHPRPSSRSASTARRPAWSLDPRRARPATPPRPGGPWPSRARGRRATGPRPGPGAPQPRLPGAAPRRRLTRSLPRADPAAPPGTGCRPAGAAPGRSTTPSRYRLVS